MSRPHHTTDCHKFHHLVVDFGQNPQKMHRARPQIACVSGSMRFAPAMQAHAEVLSLDGWIVVMPHVNGNITPLTPGEKFKLDGLHLAKIDLADEVHVIDVDGHIDESTRREIAYATVAGKPVHYFGENYRRSHS